MKINITNRSSAIIYNKRDLFLSEIRTSSLIRMKFRKLFAEMEPEILRVENEAKHLLKEYPDLTQDMEQKLISSGNKPFLSVLESLKELENIVNSYEIDIDKSTIDELANQVTITDFSDLFEVLV